MNSSRIIAACCIVAVIAAGYWYAYKSSAPVQERPAFLLVNVLEEKDFENARIKGSIHVSFDDIENMTSVWNKETPIVFYCSNYMCTASGHAAQRFVAAGFKDVSAYEAGLAEWYQLSKNDSEYALEGALDLSVSPYLEVVVPRPDHKTSPGYRIISSEELKNRLKEANLL